MPDNSDLLRHTVATLAYRLEKVVRDAPPGFERLACGGDVRTPLALLAHIGDLLEWAARMADGEYKWLPAAPPSSWEAARERAYLALAQLDARLASGPPGRPEEQIFQGPIADALTHVGQLAMLRRMAGVPIRPEAYARAKINVGRVGLEQSAERVEFDGDASASP